MGSCTAFLFAREIFRSVLLRLSLLNWGYLLFNRDGGRGAFAASVDLTHTYSSQFLPPLVVSTFFFLVVPSGYQSAARTVIDENFRYSFLNS